MGALMGELFIRSHYKLLWYNILEHLEELLSNFRIVCTHTVWSLETVLEKVNKFTSIIQVINIIVYIFFNIDAFKLYAGLGQR